MEIMAKRGRRRSLFKVRLRFSTVTSLGALLCFATAALIIISFSGQGQSLQAINDVLRSSFGVGALFLPFVFIVMGFVLTQVKWSFAKPQALWGSFIFFIAFITLMRSGTTGDTLFTNLSGYIQPLGTYIVSGAFIIAAFLMFTDTSIPEIISWFTSHVEIEGADEKDSKKSSEEAKLGKPVAVKLNLSSNKPDDDKSETAMTAVMATKNADSTSPLEAGTAPMENEKAALVWEYPSLSILNSTKPKEADRGDVKGNVGIIEKTLDSFGVKATVSQVDGGPSVTRYAIKVSEGTKLNRITALSNDLALRLAAPTGQIRIEAPIPGQDLVGIEVPNYSLEVVPLKRILNSKAMRQEKSKLSVALGVDVSGKEVIADISKMPHMLIAGATGSGKSVCINAFIASILFRASPNEVKMILVDPKRVELTPYNDIPHLLTPVITDPKKVVNALRWACNEMDRRYKAFEQVGARNITAFNEMTGFQQYPEILIVIDELADIMLAAPGEVEESITRIAQMARAVGIHLVVATQRPSTDVITGIIKANIPARIAFNVSSNVDSRVILDQPGAEKLLGRGDMLFIPPDQAKPVRIQGTYIADDELRNLISFLRNTGINTEYDDSITEKANGVSAPGNGGDGEVDELFWEAVRYVHESQRAATSHLQRRFSLGFTRAARILDQMEERGFVGPAQGAKPRELNPAGIQDALSQYNQS